MFGFLLWLKIDGGNVIKKNITQPLFILFLKFPNTTDVASAHIIKKLNISINKFNRSKTIATFSNYIFQII